MATFNSRNFSSIPGINLRENNGALRFEVPLITPITTTGERLLYIDSSSNLIYNNGTSAVTVGSGTSTSASTWDSIYSGDKTLAINAGVLTFAGGSSDASNVIRITNVSGSSGACLALTNSTTSNADILGTSSTWQVLGTGAATFLGATLSGAGGSTEFAITAGDMTMADGSIAVIDADNAATFSVTNNTATTASVFVFAGSGAFTGNTTSSFFTITPSGLTTGTAVYLPVAALTTGKALHIVANAYTDGLVFNLTSSSTVSTATGRLFNLAHTATLNVSHVIAEMATAAQDETILFRLTASDILALGVVQDISASSLTTGKGIRMSNLDALTTGMGLHIASAATVITTTGRLFLSDHTGAIGTSATLNEFKTAATDETILLQVTTAAMIDGVALRVVGTTGMTTGSLLLVTSSTAGALATNGVISLTCTGAFTSTSATNGGFVEIKANSTTAGTILNLVGSGLTTGIGVQLSNGTSGMTSGSLLRITASGTGTVATNGIVSITHGGIFVSTANAGVLDVRASAMVGTASNGTLVNFMTTAAAQVDTTVLNVENSGFTIGYTGSMLRIKSPTTTGACKLIDVIADGITSGGTVMNVSVAALTTGIGFTITNGTSAITTGSLVRVTASGTGAIATNGIVSITHAGIYTSTSSVDGGLLDIRAAATTAGVLVNVVAAGLITGQAVSISNATAATTTGSLLVAVAGGTGAIATNGIISFTHTGVYTSTSVVNGGFVEIKANSTTAGTILNVVGSGLITGVALSISNGTAATTTGSLLRVVAGGTGAVATNGIVNFLHSGVYTSTAATIGMFHVSASATTAGTVASISGLAVVGGNILNLDATAATLTTGRYLSANDAAGEVFGIGANGHIHSTVGASAPTIAVTTALGITAAAITAGGSDVCGIITTTGTSTGATILDVTFNKTYTTAPKFVVLSPVNTAAAMPNSGYFVSAISATGFTITVVTGGTYAATPSFRYLVIA